MAYGIHVMDDQGGLVLDTESAVFSVIDQQTYSSDFVETGLHYFDIWNWQHKNLDNILLSPPVGRWVALSMVTATGNTHGYIVSDSSTITMAKMGFAKDTPPPTGYGIAVYAANGTRLWDTQGRMLQMTDGVIRKKGDFGFTATMSGNAAGWGGYYMRAIINLSGGQRLEGPRLKRIAENTMEIEFGRVWGQNFSGGATAVFDPGDCFFYAGMLT